MTRAAGRQAGAGWQAQPPADGATETAHTEIDVGQRLRTLREARGLSIRSLAARSGLAVNTLSLIENGKSSPSVSTMQQLARTLAVPVTAFFKADLPRQNVVYQRAAKRPQALFAHGLLEDLGVGLVNRIVEPLLVTLHPHAGSGADPIVHTGQEFVYCLAGRIMYTVRDQTYLLEPGDSLTFEAYLPHRWQNAGDEPAQALLVLCPLDARDRPFEHHFALP